MLETKLNGWNMNKAIINLAMHEAIVGDTCPKHHALELNPDPCDWKVSFLKPTHTNAHTNTDRQK